VPHKVNQTPLRLTLFSGGSPTKELPLFHYRCFFEGSTIPLHDAGKVHSYLEAPDLDHELYSLSSYQRADKFALSSSLSPKLNPLRNTGGKTNRFGRMVDHKPLPQTLEGHDDWWSRRGDLCVSVLGVNGAELKRSWWLSRGRRRPIYSVPLQLAVSDRWRGTNPGNSGGRPETPARHTCTPERKARVSGGYSETPA